MCYNGTAKENFVVYIFKEETVMKRFKNLLSLILALCMVLPMTVLGAVPDYKDVPKDHWAYDSIMSLTEKGMVEGKVAGVYFDPEAPLRNTELFMTLYRLAGEPEVVPTFDFRGIFSDEDIISVK